MPSLVLFFFICLCVFGFVLLVSSGGVASGYVFMCPVLVAVEHSFPIILFHLQNDANNRAEQSYFHGRSVDMNQQPHSSIWCHLPFAQKKLRNKSCPVDRPVAWSSNETATGFHSFAHLYYQPFPSVCLSGRLYLRNGDGERQQERRRLTRDSTPFSLYCRSFTLILLCFDGDGLTLEWTTAADG